MDQAQLTTEVPASPPKIYGLSFTCMPFHHSVADNEMGAVVGGPATAVSTLGKDFYNISIYFFMSKFYAFKTEAMQHFSWRTAKYSLSHKLNEKKC